MINLDTFLSAFIISLTFCSVLSKLPTVLKIFAPFLLGSYWDNEWLPWYYTVANLLGVCEFACSHFLQEDALKPQGDDAVRHTFLDQDRPTSYRAATIEYRVETRMLAIIDNCWLYLGLRQPDIFNHVEVLASWKFQRKRKRQRQRVWRWTADSASSWRKIRIHFSRIW